METTLFDTKSEIYAGKNETTNKVFHTGGTTETKAPKRNGATTMPKELKWFACQAIRISLDGKEIERRSFPFFALSLEHARQELIGMKKAGHEMPFNEIWQYSCLNQQEKKFPKMKLEASKINIETGKKS